MGRELRWNPISLAMVSWILKGVLKNIWDLVSMMDVPDDAAKLSRMDFKVLASRRVGEPISMVSSTNWVWETRGLRLWMDMPCKVELWMATWMVLLRPSAIRMKRNG